MKLADIDPIIKAIEARQENAEDLPPLTAGDFLRMLREASEPKTGGIQMIIRGDGSAEQYDDTFDLTIHCTSEDEQKEVLKIMETAAKLRKPHGALIDRDALGNIKFTDTNHDYRLGWNEAIEAIVENADVIIERSGENV